MGGVSYSYIRTASYIRMPRALCAPRHNIDPKPDELALARLKFPEREMEDRTGELFNTLG